jgi:hypothetical protein
MSLKSRFLSLIPKKSTPEERRFFQELSKAVEGSGQQRSSSDAVYDKFIGALGKLGFPVRTDGSLNVNTPTVPTGFEVNAGFTTIMLKWDAPTYAGHDHTEVYRAETDDLNAALANGVHLRAYYQLIADSAEMDQGYYYWVRHVNKVGQKSGFNAPQGTYGRTQVNIAQVIENLEGEISETQLAQDLAGRIDLIDTDDLVGSVGYRVNELKQYTDGKVSDVNQYVDGIRDLIDQRIDGFELDVTGRLGDVNTGLTDINDQLELADQRVSDLSLHVEDKIDSLKLDSIRMADDLGASTLEAILRTERLGQSLRDVGIEWDKENGKATFFAVDNAQERISEVFVELDAVNATLTQKVTLAEVDQALTNYILDPTQLPEIEDIRGTLNDLEIELNGVQGAITLKADTTLITDPENGLNVRVNSAVQRIDSLEGVVSTKLDSSEFTPVEARLTQAEQELSILDGAQFTTMVADSKFKAERDDLTAYDVLRGALGLQDNYKKFANEIAVARQELNAKVNDNSEAEASARLELLAKINDNSGAIVQEQVVRSTETSALAQDISGLVAVVEDPLTGLNSKASNNQLSEAMATEQEARATAISDMKAEVESEEGVLSGRISDLSEVITNPETGVITQRITQFKAELEGEDGLITATNNRVDSAIATEREVRASSIQDLSSGMSAIDKDLALAEMVEFDERLKASLKIDRVAKEVAIARRELNTKVNDNREAEASERLLLLARIDDNEGMIFNESLVRASEDAVLAGQINVLDTKFTGEIATTSANIAQLNEAISDESEARATSVTALDTKFTGELVNTNASIAQLNEAISDESEARATSISDLDTKFTNDLATTNANVTSLSEAISDESEARATSISSLSASLVISNLLYNEDYSLGYSFGTHSSDAVLRAAQTVSLRPAGVDWAPADRPVLEIMQGLPVNTGNIEVVVYFNNLLIGVDNGTGAPAKAGRKYAVSAKVSAHRCDSRIALVFRESDKTWISAVYSKLNEGVAGNIADPESYMHLCASGVAPAGTEFVQLIVLKSDTYVGQNSSYTFVHKPMLSEVSLDSDYNDDNPLPYQGVSSDIVQLNKVSVTEKEARTTSVAELDTKFTGEFAATNANVTSLSEAISDESEARATALTALESNFNGQLDTKASITQLNEAISTESSARATAIQQAAASLNDTIAAVETKAEAAIDGVDDINLQYTVKLDANGYVSGFGLMNDGETSDFRINADRFSIGKPGVSDRSPFIFDTTNDKLYLSGDVHVLGTMSVSGLDSGKLGSGVDFIIGEDAIMMNGDGSFVLSGAGGPATNNYMSLTSDGELVSFLYRGAGLGHIPYKSLKRVESGVANNGVTVNIPGYWTQRPSIAVSPSYIKSYSSAYSQQDQFWHVSADEVIEVSTGQWSFKPVARLELGDSSGVQALNLNSGSISTNTYTSGLVITPANTSSIDIAVSASSVRGTGTTPNFYYRKVDWRVKYRVVGSTSWSYSSYKTITYGASQSAIADSRVLALSPAAYEYQVEFVSADAGGTYSSGSVEYDYNTASVSKATEVSKSVNGINDSLSFGLPSYSPPSGWSVYTVTYAFQYAYRLASNTTMVGASVQMQNANVFHMLGSNSTAGDINTWINKSVTSSSYNTGFLDGSLGSSCHISSCSSASLKVRNATVSIGIRRPRTNSTTPSNSFSVTGYSYELSSALVLEEGTLNWLAIGV